MSSIRDSVRAVRVGALAAVLLILAGCSNDDEGGGGCFDECEAGQSRCEGSVIEVCVSRDDGCLGFQASYDCADHQMLCDDSTGDASCIGGCENECPAAGRLGCSDVMLRICGTGAHGCLVWQDQIDCSANGGTCEETTDDATCVGGCGERIIFDDTIYWEWPEGVHFYGGYGFYWWHRYGEAEYMVADYGEMPTDDWTSPDDYFNGIVHFRFEVVDQPTSRPFLIQMGIWQDYGLQPHHRECIGPHISLDGGSGSLSESTDGSSFSTWWNHPDAPGPCDFTRPEDFYRIGIVLWDQEYMCIPMGTEWSPNGCPEHQAEFFPMTARVTAVAVPAGESFSGWQSYP